MTNNPELDAVWATIPERADVEKAIADLKAYKASLTPAPNPDDARNAVIGEAAAAVIAGGQFPRDLGKRAAAAYTDALAANAEWAAAGDAERGLKARLESVREVYRGDLLDALGSRLDALLSDVRTIVARSGHIIDGDAAIEAGGTAVEDYASLRALLKRLGDITAALRHVLAPGTDASGLAEAYRRGHDAVRGLTSEPVPAHIEDALLHKEPRGIEYLLWLSECGRAWVPTSEAALLAERLMPDFGIPDGPIKDYTPAVRPISAPPQPVRTGFERTPDISMTARSN